LLARGRKILVLHTLQLLNGSIRGQLLSTFRIDYQEWDSLAIDLPIQGWTGGRLADPDVFKQVG
jgi:hypothetical protein